MNPGTIIVRLGLALVRAVIRTTKRSEAPPNGGKKPPGSKLRDSPPSNAEPLNVSTLIPLRECDLRKQKSLALQEIPEEWQHIPEAQRLEEAQAELVRVIEARLQEINSCPWDDLLAPSSVVGKSLPFAEAELREARTAFYAVTGYPLPQAVLEKIKEDFPPAEQQFVTNLMNECGRTLSHHEELRLCVLALSNGDLTKLRRLVEDDWRDVYMAADQVAGDMTARRYGGRQPTKDRGLS
jgi:hypothetical protein